MSDLQPILERIAGLPKPVLVGIGGAVAVGKSTIAATLSDSLGARVVSTDAFLLPNSVLSERGLLMEKGFPDTYDVDAMTRVLRALRERQTALAPRYSHAIYDVVPDVHDEIAPADVVLLEGVVALQDYVYRGLDLRLYVDAPTDVVRGWFVDRFIRWTEDARTTPSFYSMFVDLPPDALRAAAEEVWDNINGVNLERHIAATRANADLVVTKRVDHSIFSITPPA